MNLLSKIIGRFLAISALIACAAVTRANTTSVSPKGLSSPSVDQTHGLPNPQNLISQQLLTSDWTITLLPAGYTPIDVSTDGNVVLLYKQVGDFSYYYRWSSDGNLENLGASDVGFDPTAHVSLNSAGTIGMSKGTIETPSDMVVKWALIDKSYQLLYIAPYSSVTDYGAYGGPFTHFFGNAGLRKLDDFNRSWITVSRYDPTNTPGFNSSDSLVRIDASGIQTTIFSNSGNPFTPGHISYGLIGISRNGSFIYGFNGIDGNGFSTPGRFFIDTTELSFGPTYISDTGYVIGDRTETDHVVRFPNGHEESATNNAGRVLWVDSQNRLRGHPLTTFEPGVFIPKIGSDGQPITPAQYDFVPEVPLSVPDGWTTDHTVAPNTFAPQIGFVVNSETGASLPFVATARIQLAVDSNRDGFIKLAGEDGADVTSAANPFRFWVNDGADGPSPIPGESSVQDSLQLSSTLQPNWLRGSITCERDLENFARLWLTVSSGLRQAIISGQITLGLEWQSNTGNALNGWAIADGTPELRIYEAAPKHGDTNSTGGTEYLTDSATATDQVLHKSIPLLDVRKGFPGYFTPTAFANLTDATPNLYLLFEGVSRGTGRLVITLNTGSQGNYTKIGNGGFVYMDLKNTKELYERWSVGDGPISISNNLLANGGGSPLSVAGISADRLPSEVKGLQYSSGAPGLSIPDDSNGNKYILYVHGWNMAPWEKDAFAETMLKRLYWQGYKGKFGTFQWPTTYSNSSTFNNNTQQISSYDDGEYSAWQSAVPLKNLLTTLYGAYHNQNGGSNVYLLAHSMGNVVAGEAMRIIGQSGAGQLLNTYVATQAAVPAHCYDATLVGNDLLDFTHVLSKPGLYGPDTPDIHSSWLTATSAAVQSKSNFYNLNDFALRFWESDQVLKPDIRSFVYYYASSDLTSMQNLFKKSTYPDPVSAALIIKNHTGIFPTQLELGDATNVRDRYEIMAYDAEPRSKSLGAVSDISNTTFGSSQNMQEVWPNDTFPQTDGLYSAHPWHSAQFRFTNADQEYYWQQIMIKFGNVPNPLPPKP